jgi:hypothetical protein
LITKVQNSNKHLHLVVEMLKAEIEQNIKWFFFDIL